MPQASHSDLSLVPLIGNELAFEPAKQPSKPDEVKAVPISPESNTLALPDVNKTARKKSNEADNSVWLEEIKKTCQELRASNQVQTFKVVESNPNQMFPGNKAIEVVFKDGGQCEMSAAKVVLKSGFKTSDLQAAARLVAANPNFSKGAVIKSGNGNAPEYIYQLALSLAAQGIAVRSINYPDQEATQKVLKLIQDKAAACRATLDNSSTTAGEKQKANKELELLKFVLPPTAQTHQEVSNLSTSSPRQVALA